MELESFKQKYFPFIVAIYIRWHKKKTSPDGYAYSTLNKVFSLLGQWVTIYLVQSYSTETVSA